MKREADEIKNKELEIIGRRVREARIAKGLTQDEVAEKMGYTSRTTINKIEMGINGVPNSKLSLLAEILNVDISYLLVGDNKKESALLTLTSKDGKVKTMQITDKQYDIMLRALNIFEIEKDADEKVASLLSEIYNISHVDLKK